MHQYKTIAQTLLILSILNLVYAAPVIPQKTHDTVNDMEGEDVIGMSDRRRGALPLDAGGTTPSQYPSSPPPDGSSALHSLGIDEGSLRDSTIEPSTPAHPLSTTDGLGPVPDPNTGASTSSHAPLYMERPVPVPGSTPGGSTTEDYYQVTHAMLNKGPRFYQKPVVKAAAGMAAFTAFIAALVIFSALQNKKEDKTP